MKTKIIKIITVVSGLGLLVLAVGNGCSGGLETNLSSSGSASSDSNGENAVNQLPAAEESDFVEKAKTVSVIYSQKALDQLTSCVGVESPSDASLAMYESKKGAISVYGNPDSITPPMMMAVLSIAGEVCNDLINQELRTPARRFFQGWDFNSNNLPSQSQLNEVLGKLALSCWHRTETNEEREQMADLMTSIAAGEAQATRKSALQICTWAISSMRGILD